MPVQDTATLFAALLSIPFGDRYPTLAPNPAQQRRRTLAALLDHFENLARQKPILFVFEDAQWADATSLELLDLTVERVRELPIFALFTLRPDFEPPWDGLPNVGTLTLGRLSRDTVESIVTQVTGGRALPAEVMNQIVAKTDGNPLFVEELTKAVLEGDILVKDADGYRLDGPLPPLAIPATLQASLMARLDRLAPVKEIGQIGATIGREFSYPLMREVAGRDETALKQALDKLEQGGLVFRRGEPPEAIYSFKHALVRDAAYESLLKSRRKQFHARIAEILARSGNIDASHEVLAHHFMEAGEVERAAHHWFQAAKYAGARYANYEAMAHCTKSLTALSQLSRSAERTKMELGVRIILADGLRITDRYSEALTELSSAEPIAIETEHVLELSRIHHMRGNIYYFLGKIEPCLAEHEAAWNFSKKTGSIEDEARALGGLGDANFLMGRINDAYQKFDHCIKLSRANELFTTEVAYLPMRAVTHMYSLRFDESIDDCNATIDLVKRIGQARGELIARSTSSWVLFDKCELPIAEHHAQKGLEAVSVIGSRRFIPLFNDVIARIRLLAGDREGALELLEESWNVAREASIAFAGPVVLGAVALATKDPKRRAEALQQGEAILQEGCASHNHFRFYRDAIEISLRECLWDDAKYYATAFERCFGAQSSAWSDFIIARGRALAETANERPSQSARLRLRQLRDHALSVGMRATVPQLDQALGEGVPQL
jgi:tetratricopeptide (TPR) repeat protein